MSCTTLRQELLDVAQNLGDALFLFEDAGDELLGGQMGDVFLGARVLAI
jgi:hypothetical protein